MENSTTFGDNSTTSRDNSTTLRDNSTTPNNNSTTPYHQPSRLTPNRLGRSVKPATIGMILKLSFESSQYGSGKYSTLGEKGSV